VLFRSLGGSGGGGNGEQAAWYGGSFGTAGTAITATTGNVNTGSGGGGGGSEPGPATASGAAGGSGIEIVRYTTPAVTFNLPPTSSFISEGSNVVFTLNTTNVSNNTLLYYYTTGNILASDFVTGNTGSFRTTQNSTTITLSSNTNIPFNQEKYLQLKIASEAGTSAEPLITSNVVTIRDITILPMSATGGVQSNISGYRIHTLTSNGLISFNKAGTIEYLIIGAGGSKATFAGAGAGGLLQGTLNVSDITYVANVGPWVDNYGRQGENTTAFGLIAYGGGSGNNEGTPSIPGTNPGMPGGSGAGHGGSNGAGSGGSGVSGQGYPGGSGGPAYGSAGGGGGAGQAGSNGTGAGGTGAGGNGIWSTITGSNVAYAGGGSAGPYAGGSPWGRTGYGGGGGPGPGYSGVVIFRYSTNAGAAVNITTPADFVIEGSNVVFTLNTTNVSNNTLLYYYTVGNVISSDFITGNTGSFRTTLNSTTIRLPSNTNIPSNEERSFQLKIAGDAGTSADPLITSNVFTIKDIALQPRASVVEYLVVAGGGGGGTGNGNGIGDGGGGGGGGLLTSNVVISPGVSYTITVGNGGAGGTRGVNGGNSVISGSGFTTITAIGGGGGGGEGYGGGLNGGSGGGGGKAPASTAGTGTAGQGNNGGAGGAGGLQVGACGGGGGGAGAVGSAGTADSNNGGIGALSSISGTATYYAGGGGSGFAGTNVAGGGGTAGSNGVVNTGGGGGQGSGYGQRAGGSGIVIVRYPDTLATAAATTGSPNVIYANANIIYRFWQSGTITF
jgi:hypothetical protein